MTGRPTRRDLLRSSVGIALAACIPTATTRDAEAATATREPTAEERAAYPFIPKDAKIRSVEETLAPPKGLSRVAATAGSFAAYLRGLPLRAAGAPVRDFRGGELRAGTDKRIAAVAELDVSPADIQQCADSIIRLHAEWLWSLGRKDAIGYHFLSGDFATYARYAAGERPIVKGNKVTWATTAKPSDSRATFRAYLDMVFNYASTLSLAARTKKIEPKDVVPGDFFILPGGPGHCVLVLDMATDASGNRAVLLGQGFMPAQDFQVLASQESGRSPWFALAGDDGVDTPFWEPFPWSSLRRFEAPAAKKDKTR